MKNTYKELIDKLRRHGEFYKPSNQSDLYFQAADAIEKLSSRKLTKLFKRRKTNVRN